MKQLARLQFSSFQLKVPQDWKTPSGDPDAKHYSDAFKPEEKNTTPVTAMPLFMAASMNKYHTDTQKMHQAKIGAYIDGMCTAICSAWSQWQTMATLVGVVVNAVTAVGGQVVGPPLQGLIMASGPPMATPAEIKYTNVIAQVIGTSWLSYTAGIKVKGMPWYPAFAAVPSPVAPPAPNVPCPFAALTQVPASISMAALKGQMIGQLGDPDAPFHKELFESIADAFEKTYNLWKVSTMVTNVLGTGPVPTFAPPYVPVGPVVGGVGTMTPGGFT